MSARLSSEQWSDFWRAGSITTFMGRFADNYDGIVLEFWRKIFDALPRAARIVDLATGNGALALLASQYSEARGVEFEVTGVDFAATDPKQMLRSRDIGPAFNRIRFLPSTRIEQTGLPDGTFDLVCSQFGFEYAEGRAAVAEAVRLMAGDKAIFAAMMHREDSAIVEQAREGIRQDAQCRKSGLVGAVEKLLRAVEDARSRGQAPADCARCEGHRAVVNQITQKLHSAQSQYQDPGQLAYCMRSIMATFDPARSTGLTTEEKIKRIREVDAESRLYAERMRDLMSSALSQAEIDALCTEFARLGLTIDYSREIDFEGKLFCHALVAVR